MARRGQGEGSIMRRKDGRYQAALTLDNHKRKYFYGKTRKEVQDKLNSELLGHSSVAITADIYGHVLPEMRREVVKKVDDLYGNS